LHTRNKRKQFKSILFLTILLLSVFTISFIYTQVSIAQPQITRITPSTHKGKVGETIKIEGTIETENGAFNIFFDEELMTSGKAEGINIKASFSVPHRPVGNYTILLQDVIQNKNASTWFAVQTAYGIMPELLPEPKRFQQNASVVLHINVTGGEPNKVYHANVTVKLPYPLNITYSAMVELSNTTSTGFGYANITYPDEFPLEAHTNFTGMYLVYFNQTENLAEHGFFIGMLDAGKYHREQLADIYAVGYMPNETATISIVFVKTIYGDTVNETVYIDTVNASQQGTIHINWPIPENASIGVYNLTIIGKNTTKLVKDSQLFSIPGYKIDVYTQNLAGEPVSGIRLEALDNATNTKFNKTSESNGLATLQLEKGDHFFEAFWKGVKVGEMNVTITGEAQYNITCKLTDLTVIVKDERGTPIPFVYLNISYQFTTRENMLKNETLTGETDFSGTFKVGSTLPHITYTINASRYGKIFNVNNNTVLSLPAKKRMNITILCPAKILTLNITDHDYKPFPNARIEAIEQMGGIFYVETTDSSGIATIRCTFGKYNLKVYAGSILLNETSINMFDNQSLEIYCKLYNLTVSVKAVDYFGQPIPNVNVTLIRESTQPISKRTATDGIATFYKVIGGKFQVAAYLNEESKPLVSTIAYIEEHRTITLKIERYTLIAGMLIETSQLAVITAIIVILIVVLIIELYRKRKRGK